MTVIVCIVTFYNPHTEAAVNNDWQRYSKSSASISSHQKNSPRQRSQRQQVTPPSQNKKTPQPGNRYQYKPPKTYSPPRDPYFPYLRIPPLPPHHPPGQTPP